MKSVGGEVAQAAADAAMTVGKVWHWQVAQMAVWVVGRDNVETVWNAESYSAERRWQCHLLREIFGNPFRPVSVDPAWLTSTVLLLALGIYDDRAFDRMPILADALQDAGCDSDDILNHCRDSNATHVRGCWALDLVLGKS